MLLHVLASLSPGLSVASLPPVQGLEPAPEPAPVAVAAPAPALAWIDYDGDGLLDLFVADAADGDHLLRNRGQGVFEDRLHLSGLDSAGGSRLAAWIDFDGDARPDVYRVAADRTGDLWRNMGDGTFAPVASYLGLPAGPAILSARWVDFDGDLQPDLELVSSRGVEIYRNSEGAFELALELASSPATEPIALALPPPADSAGAPLPTDGGRVVVENATTPAPGSAPVTGTTKVGDREAALSFCSFGVQDQALPGNCIPGSSSPTLGMLYPLSADLFVAASGNVGIGTTLPLDRLDVAGTLRADGLRLPTGAQSGYVLTTDATGTASWAQLPGGGLGGSGTPGRLPIFVTPGTIGNSSVYESAGRIGIGTTSPTLSSLHVKSATSDAALRVEGPEVNGSGGALAFGTSDAFTYIEETEDDGLNVVAAAGVGLGPGNVGVKLATLAEATHSLTIGSYAGQNDVLRLIGPDGFYGYGARLEFGDSGFVRLEEDTDDHLQVLTHAGTTVTTTGTVAVPALEIEQAMGSGTLSPALHLDNTSTFQGIALFAETNGTDANAVFTQHGSGSILRGFSSGLVFEVRNDGRLVCKSVEITGGSDLVESFDTGEAVEPGTVLCIDPDRPGRLTTSRAPYDPRVAGVASGAGGIQPGLHLVQEGVTEGDTPVAMAGRVYVRASAENGAIRPGDLLTTAALPGHAMRASDHDRSFGAVIGKAMTPLDEGTGLVLVLINLQ